VERRGRIREVKGGAEGARVPPHDLDAERAVIGAMLVSETAVAAVAEVLSAEDFYSEIHRILYGAMMRLYSRGDPIDQLTLANELRSVSEFENIGGRAYIFQLVESVPTAANAARYAEIVRGKAFLRSMIDAGSRMLEDAFQEPENVNEVLDAAEQLIYNISTESLGAHLAPVSELATDTLELIQRLYETEGPVTGVETGFGDLDRLTTGFHKSDLIILAARPAMGKTALALNAIQHIAGTNGNPVAVFSLEMSKEQLVQRLISQETRIKTQDLRNGNVTAQDWPKLVRGVANLRRAPIWIDDTAGVTLLEIRAKVRRLASRLASQGKPLSLVVVDYLQLMMSQSNRAENRQQEIAEISRGLKVLARDLDVPVLAISQLSRAVEQRHDKRPMLADLRDSGCLTGDTQIFLPDEGVYEQLDRLIGRAGFRVMAVDVNSWKLEPRVVTNSFSTGRKQVFELVSRLGRRVRATANHKFLTVAGWRRLDELAAGARVALPRRLPGRVEQTMRDEELALLGHLIGDGCVLPRQPIHYTTNDPLLAEAVAMLARRVFGGAVTPRIVRERNWCQVYLAATRPLTHGRRNPVSAWLDRMNIFGLRSYEKRVPREVFGQPDSAVALFLRHLWATDGCVYFGSGRPRVYYVSKSAALAKNVQSLLLRLGVNARLGRVSQGAKGRDQFHVDISGKPEIERFLEQVGGMGQSKMLHQTAITNHLNIRSANTNRDALPRELWHSIVVPSMQAAGVSSREMQTAIGQTYCGTSLYMRNMSRERAARVAEAVSSSTLARLAASDIHWDEVISIEPAGEEEVYDLTIEGLHNFVANDIIVHNSIEQDADLVMFLYRDEYYNSESERKGEADIIVGKHRNGPTGTVTLAWMEQYTKFASLARRV
jgi:replicative DNA helicase